MKPFYEKDGITIYCGDHLEVLSKLNLQVDLTVTSPPYDNLRDYNGYDFDFESLSKLLYSSTVDGGVVVWIVGDATIDGSETGTSFRQALGFMADGFNLHDTMMYEKLAPPPQYKVGRYTNSFEYMFVFSNGRPKTVNYILDSVKTPNVITKNYQGQRLKNGQPNRKINKVYKSAKIKNNIWGYNQAKIFRVGNHPAQFPEKLAHDHIISWSNENDLVLDPMCGSGTTLKMARQLNRRAIGIDVSEEYCKIAVQRLEGGMVEGFETNEQLKKSVRRYNLF